MTFLKMTELVNKFGLEYSLDDFLKDDRVGQQVRTKNPPVHIK